MLGTPPDSDNATVNKKDNFPVFRKLKFQQNEKTEKYKNSESDVM